MRRRAFIGWLALPWVGGTAIADEVPQADLPPPVTMGQVPDRSQQPLPPLAQGRASWYGGQRWHGRRTASGERFDRHALTAAHRNLPFGTWLRVVNLANGREVHVRINDRGPFGKRFIIDLSEAAAEQLGFRSAGTAQVRLHLADAPDTHQSRR